MEAAVREAVDHISDDAVLAQLVELVLEEEIEKRPLFPNLLDEPVFFRRYFRRWVMEALKEKQSIGDATKNDLNAFFGAK
jgi:hypothetical protein